MNDLQTLIIQLAALGGLAALIAVVVDWLKKFGVVKDGQAPVWVTGFNLIALVVLFFAVNILKIDVTKYDALFGNVAQILVLFLSLVGQVKVSRATHAAFDGVKLLNFRYGYDAPANPRSVIKTVILFAIGIVALASVFTVAPVASAQTSVPLCTLPDAQARLAQEPELKIIASMRSVNEILIACDKLAFDYKFGLANGYTKDDPRWGLSHWQRMDAYAFSVGVLPPYITDMNWSHDWKIALPIYQRLFSYDPK